MLPDPPGAKHSALRLCKSILRHSKIWLIEWSNFGAPETTVQICRRLREKLRSLRSSTGDFDSSWDCYAASEEDLVLYSHGGDSGITTRNFVWPYSSLFQSHGQQHHNLVCIIYVSLSIYIQSIWLQMELENNRRSTWTHPLSIQREFLSTSGSGSRRVQIRWEDIILPGVEDQCNCIDPRNLGQSK